MRGTGEDTLRHLFCRGEIRTDGWKSDWRREQERRRIEAIAPRTVVTAPQIKVRQERKPAAPKPPRKPKAKPISNRDHMRRIRQANRAKGLCGSCGEPTQKGRYSCVKCLEAKAKWYARKKGILFAPKIIQTKSCKVCSSLLNSNNRCGLCVKHYRKSHKRLAA